MDRVCGASVERDSLSQKRCWCRGLFCGRGGARMSSELRRDFKVSGHAASREQFHNFLGARDLFDPDQKREKWLTRLDTWSGAKRSSTSTTKPRRLSHAV
jgi:hypothetical protein